MKRLFIAIELPPQVKNKLSDFQRELKSFAQNAKWVRTEGIHLTLKFLGNVQEERIAEICSGLREVSAAPFSVQIIGCGFFPDSRRPNVFWAGVEGTGLGPLQQKVEESTARLGFEKENRAFNPHLTLARFRDSHGLHSLVREAERKKDVRLSEFIASHFSLYESILHRQGAQHVVIETVPLS